MAELRKQLGKAAVQVTFCPTRGNLSRNVTVTESLKNSEAGTGRTAHRSHKIAFEEVLQQDIYTIPISNKHNTQRPAWLGLLQAQSASLQPQGEAMESVGDKIIYVLEGRVVHFPLGSDILKDPLGVLVEAS